MVSARDKSSTPRPRRPPATTPEARENQLIAAALDLVEKQIEDGTVSATVLSQYVKYASTRERHEQEKLQRENDLLRAKAEQIEAQQRSEEMFEKAIAAMKSYQGLESEDI